MAAGVVVTGTGVVSALGNSRRELYAGLCGGRTALRPTVRFADGPAAGLTTGEIADFDPRQFLSEGNLRPLDRTCQLLTAATELALRDSGWTDAMRQAREVGLVVGTMFCSAHTISEFDRRALREGPRYASPLDFANTVINAAAGQAAIWHNLRGVNSTLSSGLSSGLQALGYASDLIRAGRADAVLAAGVEELCFETLLGFSRTGWMCPQENPLPIPFAKGRNGFALAEGAGVLMLEDEQRAAARGATVLARVRGQGTGFAAGPDAASLARSFEEALRDAGLAAADIDVVSASANGSVVADGCEAEALATVFRDSSPGPTVIAIKSLLGEALSASGALQAIAAIEGFVDRRFPAAASSDLDWGWKKGGEQNRNRERPCRHTLINSVGIDGNSCALVVAAPPAAAS